MRDRIGLVVLIVALLAGIGYVTRRRPVVRPRAPAHPAERPREDAAVQSTLREVEALRDLRRRRPLPPGGGGDAEYGRALDRAAAGAPSSLHWLEEIALDRREDPALRVDLIDLISRQRGEPTRLFLATLVGDPEESVAVRIAAVASLQTYRDPATFEVLRRAFEDPSPFAGRYHLCVAMGENGQPGAVPVLRGASVPAQAPEVRRHAAIGLGGFVEDAAVREDLRRLARDADPFVRQNALASLCRSPLAEVDAFLSELAGSEDEATRRLVQALREQRARKP
jgi:HEAT repeat protein